MVTSQLSATASPLLLSFEGSPASGYEAAWRIAAGGDATVRVLRGKKMRTFMALWDEFGAALQFPDYFGENWPALDECLADLSWMPAVTRVLIIVDALQVLADEDDESLALLIDVLARVGESWATPVVLGEPWDRPAVPFHVVLQMSADEQATVVSKWAKPGVPLAPLQMT